MTFFRLLYHLGFVPNHCCGCFSVHAFCFLSQLNASCGSYEEADWSNHAWTLPHLKQIICELFKMTDRPYILVTLASLLR